MLSEKELARLRQVVGTSDSQLVRFFDALGDTNRFKIFMLLIKSKGDICVTEFADILGISVPAASQQLKNLELAGLIKRIREGQTICYKIRLDDQEVKSIVKTFQATV